MIINYANRTVQKLEDIESGIVFKYSGDFYITTNKLDDDVRTCVNVTLGSLHNIACSIVVETYYNSYITIKGSD